MANLLTILIRRRLTQRQPLIQHPESRYKRQPDGDAPHTVNLEYLAVPIDCVLVDGEEDGDDERALHHIAEQ